MPPPLKMDSCPHRPRTALRAIHFTKTRGQMPQHNMSWGKKRTARSEPSPLDVFKVFTRPFSLNFGRKPPKSRPGSSFSESNPNSSSKVCSYPNLRNSSTSPHMTLSKRLQRWGWFARLWGAKPWVSDRNAIVRIFMEVIEEITICSMWLGRDVRISRRQSPG